MNVLSVTFSNILPPGRDVEWWKLVYITGRKIKSIAVKGEKLLSPLRPVPAWVWLVCVRPDPGIAWCRRERARSTNSGILTLRKRNIPRRAGLGLFPQTRQALSLPSVSPFSLCFSQINFSTQKTPSSGGWWFDCKVHADRSFYCVQKRKKGPGFGTETTHESVKCMTPLLRRQLECEPQSDIVPHFTSRPTFVSQPLPLCTEEFFEGFKTEDSARTKTTDAVVPDWQEGLSQDNCSKWRLISSGCSDATSDIQAKKYPRTRSFSGSLANVCPSCENVLSREWALASWFAVHSPL